METFMEVNKETALRLWVQQFGKKQKAVDFAGREIAKAAYNDRNSDFGWNVDHIYPESKGGKTADYNLICCHILTNDEKADKTSFTANGKKFEIHKKQNHYEVVLCDAEQEEIDTVNFLDSAQGLDFWESCGDAHSKEQQTLVGYVKVFMELNNKQSDSFIRRYKNFLSELFNTKNVFTHQDKKEFFNDYSATLRFIQHTGSGYCYNDQIVALIDINDVHQIENLLEDCITLNTYNEYFTMQEYAERLSVICGVYQCKDALFEYHRVLKDVFERKSDPRSSGYAFFSQDERCTHLSIDECVKSNTSAPQWYNSATKEEIRKNGDFYSFDLVWTSLQSGLKKHSKT